VLDEGVPELLTELGKKFLIFKSVEMCDLVHTLGDRGFTVYYAFRMDKYFWAEMLAPMFFLVGLWLTSQVFFRKYNKRGYRWSAVFSGLALLLMFFVWFFVSRYSNQFQCEAAYGEMASDPKMCDNPAAGFAAIIQIPFLLLAWLMISILAVFKLKPLNVKSIST
jgi:hypothetical protein